MMLVLVLDRLSKPTGSRRPQLIKIVPAFLVVVFHQACPAEERRRRVEAIGQLLGLGEVMDSRVGGALDRGISGTQRAYDM